jgi:hypothetical protein
MCEWRMVNDLRTGNNDLMTNNSTRTPNKEWRMVNNLRTGKNDPMTNDTTRISNKEFRI